MHAEIMAFLEDLLHKAEACDLQLIDEKEIGYGIQVKFNSKDESIPVNIYYSKKKGISTVIGGSPRNKLRPLLQKLLRKPIDEIEIKHNWQNWVGSDESGKGDFFGPLIVAAFYGERKIIPYLNQIGVKDSKLLSDNEIETLGKRLYAAYFNQIKTVTLLPESYNRSYREFKGKGKNLNDMLAWMHARAIMDLQKKFQPEGVLIDKFTSDQRIRQALQGMRNIPFTSRIKGEEDLFVAAASIIARFHLNRWFKKNSEELDLIIPRGAGKKVDDTACFLAAKHGEEKLHRYVKMHFANYKKLNLDG